VNWKRKTMKYRSPDDCYYAEWVMDYNDGDEWELPAQIDLAPFVIFLWVVLGTLLG
jgi:hypothetical protein